MGAGLKQVALFCLIVVILIPAVVVMTVTFPFPTPTGKGPVVAVYVEGKGLQHLPLEEYLKGVVAAEMPAIFDLEALKAQAVAARTYTVKHMRAFGGQGSPYHPGADVCTDPQHGQAWLSHEEMEQRWGRLGYLRWWPKICRAVEATEGEIITYQGRPIEAVYHSSCGGRTEGATAVWPDSEPVPYLRSVPCLYETPSPKNQEVKTFTLAELSSRLGVSLAVPAAASAPRNDLWRGRVVASRQLPHVALRLLRASPGGRVETVEIGGKVFRGTELRRLLGLRSTRFTFRIEGERVVFSTRGNGHGVGLCQYGADGMAKHGAGYRAILQHYYSGVEISSLAEFEARRN